VDAPTHPLPVASRAKRPVENGNPVVVAVPSPPDVATEVEPWRAIVERVRVARPPLASVLEHATPIEIGAGRVIIAFDPSAAFLATRAGEPEALALLTRAAQDHFGTPIVVELQSSTRPEGARTVAAIDADQRAAEISRARAAVEGHPIVQEAIRLFGAQLRDVRLPAGDG